MPSNLYELRPKSRKIGKKFDELISSLGEDDSSTLMRRLLECPKSIPRELLQEPIGKVKKKGKYWQYYSSNGNRLIYDVSDRPKKIVLILFMGDHEEAQIWLRNNSKG